MNAAQLQRALQSALNLHQAGRLDDAEKLYRQVRVAAPRLFDAVHLSGVLAYQQTRYHDALNFLTRARQLDRKHALCAQLLQRVPGSRLLLKAHGLHQPEIAGTIASRFATHGIDPARVELLGRTSGIAEHLGLYARLDVALDPFPYHGTTTTCEALWMGVPVVTLAGDRHASRVGASLLNAAGHCEWIAQTSAEYIAIAEALVNDRPRLASIRLALRDELRRSPLLDHAAQARRFGDALLACWRERAGV